MASFDQGENSYRSTPTIYNHSSKDIMASPYDDVRSMKQEHYNNSLNTVHPSDGHSLESEDNKVYRVNLNVIPVFILEIVAVGCLAALAYFLRFTDNFPVHLRGFRCDDLSISVPLNATSETSILDLRPAVLYIACTAVPLSLVLLGEIGYFLFSKTRKVIRGGCIGCRLHLSTRRIIRFSGIFLFGLFATSTITDGLKHATGSLRPYFLDACNYTECTSNKFVWSHQLCSESMDRQARMSFPSFHASLSAYAAVFAMIYIHNILAIRSSRLLRPSLEVAIGSVALLCGTIRVSTFNSHWEDVLFGFLTGICIATLLCISALNCFQEHQHAKNGICRMPSQEVTGRSPPPPFFFRYFRIPHVSYQNRSGINYPIDAHEDYSPKPAINEAFQKDLHQRIEDYNKRQGYSM